MGARGFLRGAALVGVALLGAELAARVWREARRPERIDLPWGHSLPPRDASHFVPHPFTGFALNPVFPEHSSQGFRERRTLSLEHDGTRIVALGGSNTYGTQVRYEDSLPRLLEAALGQEGHGNVEVVNAGVGAFSTANLLGHLALGVLEFEPDICLLDVGYTDAVVRVRYPGFRADYTHDYRAWQRPHKPLWRNSVLLNGVARRLGFGYETEPSIHDLAQHPYDPDFDANFAGSTIAPFRRNLVSLIGICRAHAVEPVLCTQPVDYAGHPTGEHDALWLEAMRQANEATREVAEEHDVLLVDLAAKFDGDSELFADERRMNAEGNRQRAAELARVLVERGLL